MSDIFASGKELTEVTASDSTALDFNALYVGGAGDVAIRDLDGSTITFVGVQGGSILPVRGDRVMAATTATSIVAMRW